MYLIAVYRAGLMLFVTLAPLCVAADVYVAIVAGLAGEARFEEPFRSAAADIAARSRGLTEDSSNVRVLAGADATAEAMQGMFATLARDLEDGDELMVVLIGHGTYDGTRYKFNIPGPDATDEDLKGWLDAIAGKRQLVVLATSSSGGAVATLEGERRLVIAATKSGAERNVTVFARYWVEALSYASADTDKNETISAAEAFAYTVTRVAEHYSARDRLATEHPRMKGQSANRFIVARLKPIEVHGDDPRLTALLSKRVELEDAVERLRVRRARMELEDYMRLLQDVLLELAVVEGEIERYEEPSE